MEWLEEKNEINTVLIQYTKVYFELSVNTQEDYIAAEKLW